ncbi:MAG: MMPL family transporter, partial [Candidatus Binatia bacterium]
MLERLAHVCYRRRRWVLLIWIVAFVVIGAVGGRVRGAYQTDFELPNTDSWRAFSLLGDRFPSQAGAEARIVFRATDVTAAEVKAPFEALFAELAGMDHVVEVTSPYAPGAPRISSDRRTAFASVAFDTNGPDLDRDAVIAVKDRVEAFEVPGVEIALGGQAVRFSEREGPGNEYVAVIAAVLILLVTFGSVIAMGLPILTAIFGLGVGMALIGILARAVPVPEFTPQLAAMIGLGVGIDYALFIVTRYRQTLHAGADPEQSVVVALVTSGRAVVFAGLTVVISLMGMLLMGLAFVRGVAFGAALAVLITMIASITLLPALLGFCGHAVDRLRLPFLHRDESEHRRSVWYRWSRVVQRRPLPAGLAGAAVLILMALPVLSLHLGFADESNDLPGSGPRRAYEMTAEGFGEGFNGPLILAAPLDDPLQRTALNRLSIALRDVDGVAFAAPPRLSPDRDAAVIFLVPTTGPQAAETSDLIHRLREQVLPAALGAEAPPVYVGGITALFDDLSDVMLGRLPYFIGGVVILSFLLLMVVFRSLVIPL